MKNIFKKIYNNILKKLFQNIVKYSKPIFVTSILIITIFVCGYFYYIGTHSVVRDFSNIDVSDVENLMIVAHPDDELLWGGSHLISDDYLVVCVTCGGVPERVNEFVKVMHETNDKYIMLGYPDKTNGERDNWDSHRNNIYKNLKEIINLKDWNMIVTHNPDGEYGHIHHKMTSSLVTSAVTTDNLYYFGVYHSKKAIINYYDEMAPISDSNLAQKRKIISKYKSQIFIQTMFDHMYAYEDFVKATDWSDISEKTN